MISGYFNFFTESLITSKTKTPLYEPSGGAWVVDVVTTGPANAGVVVVVGGTSSGLMTSSEATF